MRPTTRVSQQHVPDNPHNCLSTTKCAEKGFCEAAHSAPSGAVAELPKAAYPAATGQGGEFASCRSRFLAQWRRRWNG